MIFKPRRPMSDDLAPAENDAEAPPDAATTPQKAGDHATGGPTMAGAFEALAQIVSGEMEALKHSIAATEVKLARSLETEKERIHALVDEMRQDLIQRVESLQRRQEERLSDLSAQSKSSIDGLKAQLEPTLEQTVKRTEQVKTGLEQLLAAKEHKLEKELLALTHNLSGVRSDLERQISSSGRVSNLLNSMADVFSDPESLPEGRAEQAQPSADGGDR